MIKRNRDIYMNSLIYNLGAYVDPKSCVDRPTASNMLMARYGADRPMHWTISRCRGEHYSKVMEMLKEVQS